jgi:hypothetical protein
MHRFGKTLRRLAKYGIVVGGGTCILAWASIPSPEVCTTLRNGHLS